MQKNKHRHDHFNTQNLEFQEMIKSLMQLGRNTLHTWTITPFASCTIALNTLSPLSRLLT
jgi:hypothetical protein